MLNQKHFFSFAGCVNLSFAHVEGESLLVSNICYQFRVPRNLRIDIKDRLEEYSQSIKIDIHACTQSQKKLIAPSLRFGYY